MSKKETDYLKLPLPMDSNYLDEDIHRLRESFSILDANAKQSFDERQDLRDGQQSLRDEQQNIRQNMGLQGMVIDELDNKFNQTLNEAQAEIEQSLEHLRNETGASLNNMRDEMAEMLFPGICVPFKGSFGGQNNKHPIDSRSSQPNLNWHLCDGTGGTPDLRDRFVVGAGNTYGIGTTGGANTHSHTVTVNNTTLSVGQMPAHNHESYLGTGSAVNGALMVYGITQYTPANHQSLHKGDSGAHNHTASAAASANVPLYYALAFIMRVD